MNLTDKNIEKYSLLVKKCAMQIYQKINYRFELDDLIQTGYLGLIDAFNKYDCLKETSFESYALIRIRGAIYDSIRSESIVPRSYMPIIKEMEQISRQYEKLNGRKIKDEELSLQLQLPMNKLKEIQNAYQLNLLTSLDVLNETDYYSQFSFLFFDDTFEQASKSELKKILDKMMEKLSPREKEIIHSYYYLELENEEIGNRYGISASRVSQIKMKALKKIGTESNKKRLQDFY